ncbi:MAG: helix-turn-helix domain-containing protein [Gracilimonas sp.]|nr:helix-turn-helix domain-containing protein [Gracilimonas sp.]
MKIPMDRAIDIAQENLKEIRTVTEWAAKMGYGCPKYFSRRFKRSFGKSPKSKLVKIRIETFHKIILKSPELSCYEIGQKLGLGDEDNLNEYIRYHTNRSPTWWKNQE